MYLEQKDRQEKSLSKNGKLADRKRELPETKETRKGKE